MRKTILIVIIASVLATFLVGCLSKDVQISGNENKNVTIENTENTSAVAETSKQDTQFSEILSGKGKFYSSDYEKDMALDEYCTTLIDGQMLAINRFAMVDLDIDGTDEVVLEIVRMEGDALGTLILHWNEERYVGYFQYIRQMNEIKSDGSFSWSNNASNQGFARVNGFGEGEILFKHYTWMENPDGPVSYYVNEKPVEEPQYQEAVQDEMTKPGLNWIMLQ